jgi:hypothetical protein
MIELPYGYLQPQDTDDGDEFFPAIEDNWSRIASHSHDGIDSAFLSTATQAVDSGAWVAAPIGGGVYRQLVTMPDGFNYDTADIWFKLSTGEFVYPSVDRASGTTYYVYTNDNTKSYIAHYR